MTELERFRATIAGQRPEGILYTAEFTPDLRRRLIEHTAAEDLAVHFGLFEPVNVQLRRPEAFVEPDYAAYYADDDLPEDAGINADGVAWIPGGFYHFRRHHSPLRNARDLAELEAYPLPDQADWLADHMAGEVSAAHQAGKAAAGWIAHMYESAWQIRGYEQFLMDLAIRPAWAHCLLEKLFARNLVRARAAAAAGVDYIRCGDDVANQNAMMFSPPMWREFMLSRWRKVWAAAREIKPDIHIWYHSDGAISAIVGELAEAGVTILNPVQPECVDTAAVRAQFPDLNMHGTIGTQSTMPWGTPDEVCRVVRERIATCGAAGRLILGPTHVLEPEVPIGNIEAYVQAARQG